MKPTLVIVAEDECNNSESVQLLINYVTNTSEQHNNAITHAKFQTGILKSYNFRRILLTAIWHMDSKSNKCGPIVSQIQLKSMFNTTS